MCKWRRCDNYRRGKGRRRQDDVKRKTVYGVLLALVMIVIIFLTFQDAAGTVKLSETFRLWFEKVGIHTDYHSFRSNAHLVVYFVLGVVLSLFGRECGWRWWAVLVLGFGFGLIDESVKVLLPTREFDLVDLIKDWVGVGIGTVVVTTTENVRKRYK